MSRSNVTIFTGLLFAAGCGHEVPPDRPPVPPPSAEVPRPALPASASASAATKPPPAPLEVKVLKSAQPTDRTCYQITYSGLRQLLHPGEAVALDVPSGYAELGVGFVTLAHAQVRPWEGKRDPDPGLTSVQYKWTKDGTWRYWGGPASGRDGAKFAEFRDGGFEREGLYEFGHYGHAEVGKAVSGKGPHGSLLRADVSTEPLTISAARVVSVGTDDVVVDEVGLKFWPRTVAHTKEFFVVEGQKFGDYATSEHAEYSFDRKASWKLPGTKRDNRQELRIDREIVLPLSKYRGLRTVEIIGGDAPEAGGRPGRAQLAVYIRAKDGQKTYWMKGENVPPVGILKAARPVCDATAPADADLVIEGSNEDMWVSGVRIGYD